METQVVQIKLELLPDQAVKPPAPVAVFSVFDDEYFHREAILIYVGEREKEAA